MQTRRLGQSNLSVTPVTLGAWAIGGWFWGGQEEAESIRTVRASIDAGVTSIDTAPVYGFGRSEEVLGRALQGVRSHVQIMTKVGLRWDLEQGSHSWRVAIADAWWRGSSAWSWDRDAYDAAAAATSSSGSRCAVGAALSALRCVDSSAAAAAAGVSSAESAAAAAGVSSAAE